MEQADVTDDPPAVLRVLALFRPQAGIELPSAGSPGLDVLRAETAAAFEAFLDPSLAAILIDEQVDAETAARVLAVLRAQHPVPPLLILAADPDAPLAPAGLLALATDCVGRDELARLARILARVRREEAIRKSLVRSEMKRQESGVIAGSVLDSLPHHIAVVDRDGVIVRVNQAWRAFEGQNEASGPGRSVGANYLDVCRRAADAGDPLAQQALDGLQGVLDGTADGFELEYPCHSEDEKRWFHMKARPLDGTAGGAVVAHENVTARVQAQLSTQASERRLAALFEHSLDAILLMDDNGRYVDANPAACRLIGRTREELCQMSIGEASGSQDRADLGAAWKQFLESGSMKGEFTLPLGGDEPITVDYRATANILPGLHLSVVRDISERKRFEHELVAANVRAEEAVRLKSAFLANMSHEIRTPLTTIIGYADVLSFEVDGEAAEIARLIGMSGMRLYETLNSVLDLAQIDAGRATLSLEPTSLRPIIDDVLEMLRPRASEKGLSLRLHAPVEDAVVHGDRGSIFRILTNLVGNGIKFTHRGSVTVTLEVDGDDALCHVADTGIGVDATFLPHLFDEFRQESEGNTRDFEGNGLGLAISQRLVRLMGGAITVTSTKDRGSTFTVRVPLAVAETAAA